MSRFVKMSALNARLYLSNARGSFDDGGGGLGDLSGVGLFDKTEEDESDIYYIHIKYLTIIGHKMKN
jgi:hypothetical protein